MTKIELKPTARGFLHGAFRDGNGEACSVQESSAAEADYLWLGVDEIDPDCELARRFPGEGIPARMHLTREQAADLIPLLQRFVDTGRLREAGA